ncbi:MAG: hypothetical protein COB98_00920 [Flavobacteriaceae bacterium]|nr:MAG: hypothetical protein COB98_00920 [Flavobacteriaceae bacterium]
MKELKFTREELEQVDRYLNIKGLVFVDVRFEIFDHLLMDIEAEMKSKNLLFDIAFENVCLKWKESMKSTDSHWVGKGHFAPKIIIDKSVQILKKYYTILLVMMLVSALIIYIVLGYLNTIIVTYVSFFDTAIKVAVSGATFLGGYWIYKMNKSKVKSSFSFMFSKVFFPFILLNISILSNDFFTESLNVSFLSILILVCAIQSFIFLFNLWYQHNKQVSIYKKQL